MTVRGVLSAIRAIASTNIDVAIIGALARNAWAPSRATSDVDLSVSARRDALEIVGQSLEAIGYVCVRQQRADPNQELPDVLVFRNETATPKQIDILVAKSAFEKEALKRTHPVNIDGVSLPVISPEDLIVYKLIADRRRDRDDIEVVVRTLQRRGTPIDWDYIRHWADFWQILDRFEKLAAIWRS